MSEPIIEHVQQPTSMTCNQACLSMISKRPIEEIIEIFGEKGMGDQEFGRALSKIGIRWNKYTFPNIVADGLFAITVPSLNISGGAHKCVLEVRDRVQYLFDPNSGKEGKKAYDGSFPMSWGEVYQIDEEFTEFEAKEKGDHQ